MILTIKYIIMVCGNDVNIRTRSSSCQIFCLNQTLRILFVDRIFIFVMKSKMKLSLNFVRRMFRLALKMIFFVVLGYSNRHQCSSILGVPSSCQCQYLIVNRIEQILSIFVTISLVFAVIFLYLKLIASPQNGSSFFILISLFDLVVLLIFQPVQHFFSLIRHWFFSHLLWFRF